MVQSNNQLKLTVAFVRWMPTLILRTTLLVKLMLKKLTYHSISLVVQLVNVYYNTYHLATTDQIYLSTVKLSDKICSSMVLGTYKLCYIQK